MTVAVRRTLAAALVLALAAVAGIALPAASPAPAGAQADFYTPPSPLPSGRNGDIVKQQRVTYANATATRIMYLSRDVENRPMPVTGTILVPTTAWPGGGPRPIVAYAPFTAGMGDQCAVSRVIAGDVWGDFVSGVQTQFINGLLAKGIAVAQTDYQGLGTPGDHTYVMRIPQAQAVLDVIRAARSRLALARRNTSCTAGSEVRHCDNRCSGVTSACWLASASACAPTTSAFASGA